MLYGQRIINMDISKLSAPDSPKSKMIFHEDPEQLHVGTLEKHCYFIPFGSAQDPFDSRENSERFELLNGDWDFRYCDSIIDLEDDFTDVPFSKKQPCPQTGSFTAMTSPSIQMCATLYPLIRHMFPMMTLSAFTGAAILILRTEWTGYSFSREPTAVSICT